MGIGFYLMPPSTGETTTHDLIVSGKIFREIDREVKIMLAASSDDMVHLSTQDYF